MCQPTIQSLMNKCYYKSIVNKKWNIWLTYILIFTAKEVCITWIYSTNCAKKIKFFISNSSKNQLNAFYIFNKSSNWSRISLSNHFFVLDSCSASLFWIKVVKKETRDNILPSPLSQVIAFYVFTGKRSVNYCLQYFIL